MTAWMQAWSQCTDSAQTEAQPRPATPAAVPIDLRMQIATLLTGIILGLQQEATHDWNRHEKVNTGHRSETLICIYDSPPCAK